MILLLYIYIGNQSNNWLVVDLPLWKMVEWKSVGMMRFPIDGKRNIFQTTNQLWYLMAWNHSILDCSTPIKNHNIHKSKLLLATILWWMCQPNSIEHSWPYKPIKPTKLLDDRKTLRGLQVALPTRFLVPECSTIEDLILKVHRILIHLEYIYIYR